MTRASVGTVAVVMSDVSRLRLAEAAALGFSWRSWMSLLSARSALSVASVLSFASAGSILSIGSAGSILSIGSAGSILSIGSAGSILSIGSAGSILSFQRGRSVGWRRPPPADEREVAPVSPLAS